MTLADKHDAIEVLLSAAQDAYGCAVTTGEAAMVIGASTQAAVQANLQWRDCRRAIAAAGISQHAHGSLCIEAAYRLIESSPTLRREWFGRP